MSNLKKISSVVRKGVDPNSYKGSLSKYNMNRFPGTLNRKVPYLESDGRYRTGLDPNAAYIDKLPEGEREQERTRVTKLMEKAKDLLGDIDFGPRSDYYTKMTIGDEMGTPLRAPIAVLKDGDNLYNIDIPEDLVTFAYLRVHPDIAPSMGAVLTGNYPKAVYFVNDDEVEDEESSKSKRSVNKAISYLDNLTVVKMKKVGRQLGLPFTENTSENSVYVALDNFIKASEELKTRKNADLFIKFCEMKDENLAIRDTLKEALQYQVLRLNKEGHILRGRNQFAANEEEAVIYLTNSDNIDDYTSLLEEIKIKKLKTA